MSVTTGAFFWGGGEGCIPSSESVVHPFLTCCCCCVALFDIDARSILRKKKKKTAGGDGPGVQHDGPTLLPRREGTRDRPPLQ